MRISDWSSDVCSSDLAQAAGSGMAMPMDHGMMDHSRMDHGTMPQGMNMPMQMPMAPAQPSSDEQSANPPEIGRASCRERSVSVRVDLGGRSILKKKKQTYNFLQVRLNNHTKNQ